MYKLTGVTKDYRKGPDIVHALTGVDLVIEDGEWLAIQGPTGHGKTTLLQIVGALDRPFLLPVLVPEAIRRLPGERGADSECVDAP